MTGEERRPADDVPVDGPGCPGVRHDGAGTPTPDDQERLTDGATVIEAMHEGAYVIDTDRVRRFVNARLVEATGFDEDVLLSKHPERLVEEGYWSPEAGENYRAAVEAVLDGRAEERRLRLTTALNDDTEVTTETRLTPIREGEEVVGAVGIIRDVTEAAERRAALEATNRQLEELSGFLSHDLTTQLATIRGQAELAANAAGDDPDRITRSAEAVADAADRIERVADSMLTLVQSDDELTTEVVPVGSLATAVWDDLDPGAATLAATPDVTVTADRELLRRALENLLRNALEHAGPEVTVAVGVDGDALYVADDGPGIPPAQRDDVREFGTSLAGGSGLGLAIVRRVATVHDWDLAIEASREGGARIELRNVDVVD